jgi:hypothetical protein
MTVRAAMNYSNNPEGYHAVAKHPFATATEPVSSGAVIFLKDLLKHYCIFTVCLYVEENNLQRAYLQVKLGRFHGLVQAHLY